MIKLEQTLDLGAGRDPVKSSDAQGILK